MRVTGQLGPFSEALRRTSGRVFGALVVLLAGLMMVGVGSAGAAIVINEVEPDAPGGRPDFVELYNTDGAPVDISGYVLKDAGNGNNFTIPGGTTIAGNGFYFANVSGLSKDGDSVRVYLPAAGQPFATYTWNGEGKQSFGRCPDGTGEFVDTTTVTAGYANRCVDVTPGATWPGGTATAIADNPGTFGSNLSGLVYQPSGTSAPGVLWAVRNSGTSALFKLIYSGGKWVPDAANGWANGKQLFYKDGTGVPDAEGLTLVAGDPNGIYASTERNDADNGGPVSDTSRPAVLRFDTMAPGATLNATADWDLTSDFFSPLPPNAGLEAVAWVPDSLLVAKGFVTDGGVTYDPANFPNHGSGLFFVGVEDTAQVIAYALSTTDDTAWSRVARIETGFPKIADLSYEPESGHLWAVCDDTCNGQTATLDIAQSGPNAGKFFVSNKYERPAGAANLNNEGFAIAPQAECVAGLKPVFWSDDSAAPGVDDNQAIRSGTLNCTALPGSGGDPIPPGPTTPPVVTPPVVTPPVVTPGAGGGTTTPAPALAADTTAPAVQAALTVTKSGKYAVRTTGKFTVAITLDETADLTLSATAKKSSKAKKSRTILKASTRKAVTAGKQTLTLTLTKKTRKALRKGEVITVTLVAKDAAGNTRTITTTVKVK